MDFLNFYKNNFEAKKKDLDELGLKGNASNEDIKKAYRNLAKKYHPDLNKIDPNATKKFIKIRKAYDNLRDTEPLSSLIPKNSFFNPDFSFFRHINSEMLKVEQFFNSIIREFRNKTIFQPKNFFDLKKHINKRKINRIFNPFDEFDEEIENFFIKLLFDFTNF